MVEDTRVDSQTSTPPASGDSPTEESAAGNSGDAARNAYRAWAAEATRSMIREHLGLILAAIPLVLAVLRIARVSELDSTTVLVLLTTMDVASFLLATIAQTGPFLVLTITGYMIVSRRRYAPDTRAFRDLHFGLRFAIPAAGVAALLTSWQGLLLLLAVIAGIIGIDLLFEWLDRRRDRKVAAPSLLGTLGLLLVNLYVLPASMWLPPMDLTRQDGSHQTVYILDQDDQQMLLMNEHDRRIYNLETAEATSTTPCRLKDSNHRPISSLISDSKRPILGICP